MQKFLFVLTVMVAMLTLAGPAYAQDAAAGGMGNVGAGLTMGLAVLGGALGQGMAARGMYESVSRNPQAAGALNAPFYVGLAFIESLALFAFVIAYTMVSG